MTSFSTEVDDSKTTFIDKILGEMKSVFNKNSAKTDRITALDNAQKCSDVPNLEAENDLLVDKCLASPNEIVDKLNTKSNKSSVRGKSNTTDTEELAVKAEEDEEVEDNEDKPRIVLTFRTEKTKNTVSSNYGTEKDSVEESVSPGRRSLRIKANSPGDEKDKEMAKNSEVETGLKRSARRRSKDCTESILQSAIARKEKSYNETTRPQRLTRKLKPTAKILANLEMCQKNAALKKQSDKLKISPTTERERFSYENVEKGSEQAIIESDLVNQPQLKMADQLHRRFKRKHRVQLVKTCPKKSKIRVKDEEVIKESDDSDSNSFSSPLDAEVGKELIPKLEIKKSPRKSSTEDTEVVSKIFRRSSRKARNLEVEEQQDNVEISEPSLGSVADQENLTPDQPESSIVTNSGKELSRIKCLCQKNSRVFINTENAATDVITYCTALDMVNERIIGCNNSVSGEVAMLRPSTRIPYVILCAVHKERLMRHNCCPTCGLFCTQGQFTECANMHHYHRDCAVVIEGGQYCPHCSSLSPEIDVEITMKCSKNPAFLPAQKIFSPSAKMSFQPSPLKADVDPVLQRSISPPFIPSCDLELIKNTPLEKYTDETFMASDLYEAIKKTDYVMVATILKTGQLNLGETVVSNAEDGFSLLHSASQEGLLPIVHALIISGCELDMLDKDQNSPLMVAIQSFKNNVVKYLIKSGASTDLKGTDGMSALHLAAKYGNLEACELLLSAVSNSRFYINCTDDGGWTPLVWACEHGHVQVTKFLLHNGADPLLRDVEHNVALHWAAFSGSSHLLELLLNNGCDVNAVNAHGDSALHVSARQDQYNCVLILLARGANVHAVNTTLETPLSCCISETSDCHIAISLNLQLQAITENCALNVTKTILTNDISRGKELNPVQCVNAEDGEPKPIDFVYITDNCVTSDINIDRKMSTLSSCNCEDRCTSADCLCSNHSLRCWYNEEGKLITEFNFADPPMIFECNPMCACNAITCNNRVVQHGLTQRFQLFRTHGKGWGIRTLRLIPRGAYVCEYIGEIISDLEADQREDDSYLFDLDNRDGETYCIDARRYGNLSRFINHSCEPNLLPVRVYINHQDLRFPRIAFFANKDIQANEELGFDYGEKFWIIKYKSFTCTCNHLECKYSDSTIKTTLENYERRLLEDQETLQEL